MDLRKVAAFILVIAAAFSAGRFLGPKQVEIKEVERIEYRDRESTDESSQWRSRTKETTLPDGTKVKETVRERIKEKHSERDTELNSEKTKETKTTNQSDWSIGLYTNKQFLSGTIDRRILGGLFIGVYGRTDLPLGRPEFGLGLRIEF